MKTIEINLYKFDELSEEAQQKALEKLWDLNVHHGWWKFTYEDANNIGLDITDFDLYRKEIRGEFNYSPYEVAQDILNDHGDTCETYRIAQDFLNKWNPVFADYLDETSENFESYGLENEMQDMENDFLKELLTEYLSILSKEYEYQTSEEAIKESIEANEYDFTENGELY